MADSPAPLRHTDPARSDDTARAEDSKAHLAKHAGLQLVAELVTKLRAASFPWWTMPQTREIWSARARMEWLRERPDLRGEITTKLTGLAPKAARRKEPEFQAALIDSVLDDGDVSVQDFEAAFVPAQLLAYAPASDIWKKFRERLPWDQDTPAHQELMTWLIESLLSTGGVIDGHTRKPILTPLAVRTAITGKVWHTRIPLDVRVAIDDLRFQRERSSPRDPVHAQHDLTIATPAIIAGNIPLKELTRILDAAERVLALPAVDAIKSDSTKGEAAKSEAKADKGKSDNKSDKEKAEKAEAKAPPPAAAKTDPPPPRGGDEDFAFDDER